MAWPAPKIKHNYSRAGLILISWCWTICFLPGRIADVSAELLQAIVHQRYKLRRSVVITSNRVVQDWGKYLADATTATTILDRLMHRCAMLEFEGKSYRLK
jgi:hypothetical protein